MEINDKIRSFMLVEGAVLWFERQVNRGCEDAVVVMARICR